jgi:hypothetical protein
MRLTSLTLVLIIFLSFACNAIAQNSGSASHKSLTEDYLFKVGASASWTDTGLDLDPGDRVHVSGAVLGCEGPSQGEKEHLLLPSAPAGALLLKLEGEATPIVAATAADVPITVHSHLYLAVNGWLCHGSIPVSVHVDWHKPDQAHDVK